MAFALAFALAFARAFVTGSAWTAMWVYLWREVDQVYEQQRTEGWEAVQGHALDHFP